LFAAFAEKNIPLASIRGQKLMDEMLLEASLDPLPCAINVAADRPNPLPDKD